ncbi:MAG: NUDIX domain-containing protein, partial [Terriglobia bacterium]
DDGAVEVHAPEDVGDRAAFQQRADRLISANRPGDFNQALMEVGSTICLPRIPRCPACPLEKLCAARQAGLERKIPRRLAKRPRPQTTLSVLVLRRNGRLLLTREPQGLFSGLWHFPYTRGPTCRRLTRQFGVNGIRHRATLEHQTTMRDLVLRVYEARTKKSGNFGRRMRWVRPAEVERLGVNAATRKIAAALGGGRA